MSKPSHKPKTGKTIQHKPADYDNVLSGVVELLDAARRASARVVNSLMTATYWEIGRRIVEHEQAGKAGGLRRGTSHSPFGRPHETVRARIQRGQSRTMRAVLFSTSHFALNRQLRNPQSVIANFAVPPRQFANFRNGVAEISVGEMIEWLRDIAARFPLPWSHYTRLLRLRSTFAVEFYHTEAVRGRLDGEATGTADELAVLRAHRVVAEQSRDAGQRAAPSARRQSVRR